MKMPEMAVFAEQSARSSISARCLAGDGTNWQARKMNKSGKNLEKMRSWFHEEGEGQAQVTQAFQYSLLNRGR